MLKVAFINTCDFSGGAATAAHRLYMNLAKNSNVETHYIVSDKALLTSDIVSTHPTKWRKYFEKIIDKASNALGLQYQWFPISSRIILKELRAFSPDIIHIHNTHGGYFATPLFKKISKIAPVVWTLHDMWSLTNNAAYTDHFEWKSLGSHPSEKHEYPAIGIQLGNWLIRQKARIYAQSNMTLVTPSNWLRNLVLEAPVFQKKSVHHIPNGINLNIFYPKNKLHCREALDISTQDTVIIFSADRLSNPRKGGTDLLFMLDKLEKISPGSITVLLLGFTDRSFTNHNNIIFKSLGYIYDKSLLSICLSAADVLVLPTHADNLPNVLIEAIACGVPCVTYDVGGCAEIIEHNVNGYVIPKGDISSLSEAVHTLLVQPDIQLAFSIKAREKALAMFSVEKMSSHYMSLYQHILREA